MLAIQQSQAHQGICTPNILPCKIIHNGPVNSAQRFWDPSKTENSKRVAYFRGRKLHGRIAKIPEGYKGFVVESTKRKLPQDPRNVRDQVAEDEDEIVFEEAGVMDETAHFEEVVVWGHEALPDDTADPYVRGVEEWIAFAEKIHSFAYTESSQRQHGG